MYMYMYMYVYKFCNPKHFPQIHQNYCYVHVQCIIIVALLYIIHVHVYASN